MAEEFKEELCTEKCKKCKYHGRMNGTIDNKPIIICEYILQGLGRRNCSIEHCDKYEPIKETKKAKGANKK